MLQVDISGMAATPETSKCLASFMPVGDERSTAVKPGGGGDDEVDIRVVREHRVLEASLHPSIHPRRSP